MPDDADRWKREPLLFFAGGDAMAERYLETSALGYRYSDGFGDEILQESHPPAGPVPASRAERFEGEKVDAALRTDAEASAAVRVPNALLVAARTPKDKKKTRGAHSSSSAAAGHDEPELVAQLTLRPPQQPRAVRVLFFLNCSYLSTETPLSDPHYVGSLTFFGVHGIGHHTAEQIIASLPLNGTLQRLAEAGEPVRNQLKLQGIAAREPAESQVVDGALIQVAVKTV